MLIPKGAELDNAEKVSRILSIITAVAFIIAMCLDKLIK